MITLSNSGFGFHSDWYIAKIIVEKEADDGVKKYEFPCYRWVIHHLVVYEGKGKAHREQGLFSKMKNCKLNLKILINLTTVRFWDPESF